MAERTGDEVRSPESAGNQHGQAGPSCTTETPDFWDVIVSRPDHATGVVEVLEEHEELTTAEAFDVVAAMEAKYLGADDTDTVLPAATDTASSAANLTEGTGR